MTPHPLQPYWTEKAKAAMHEQRLSGRHLGKAPLGYRNVVIDGKPAIAVDPDAAPLVKEAFRLASQKVPLRKILPELDGLGLRTTQGGKLGVSSLHKILNNPFYAGFVRWDRGLIRGIHEPIITEAVFGEAQ